MPCRGAFVKGPGPILIENGITLPSAVDPTKTAILDEHHRVEVDGRFYFVASGEEMSQFLADPERYINAAAQGG